jgi:hypothetical protein
MILDYLCVEILFDTPFDSKASSQVKLLALRTQTRLSPDKLVRRVLLSLLDKAFTEQELIGHTLLLTDKQSSDTRLTVTEQ